MKSLNSGNASRLMLVGGLALSLTALASGDKMKMDGNGDGKISAAEHAAGASAMFTAMDADKNGLVTAAEMDASHQRMMQGRGDMKGMDMKGDMKGMDMKGMDMKGDMKGMDMKGMSSADKIKSMDTDKDGQVSAAEHAANAEAMFTRMDANNDGNVTDAEMKAGHDAMRGDKNM